MTHTPTQALLRAVNATRAYQATLTAPAAPSDAPRQPDPRPAPSPDPAALARLTAPTVSRLIARDIRERRREP